MKRNNVFIKKLLGNFNIASDPRILVGVKFGHAVAHQNALMIIDNNSTEQRDSFVSIKIYQIKIIYPIN